MDPGGRGDAPAAGCKAPAGAFVLFASLLPSFSMPQQPRPGNEPDASHAEVLPSAPWQVVQWHPQAPPQPAWGQPCNGCGLCCLAEPCPLGMLVSRRRSGACSALRWDDEGLRYRCGLLSDPAGVTGWRSAWLLRGVRVLARRWIAAGQGCDAEPLRVEHPDLP